MEEKCLQQQAELRGQEPLPLLNAVYRYEHHSVCNRELHVSQQSRVHVPFIMTTSGRRGHENEQKSGPLFSLTLGLLNTLWMGAPPRSVRMDVLHAAELTLVNSLQARERMRVKYWRGVAWEGSGLQDTRCCQAAQGCSYRAPLVVLITGRLPIFGISVAASVTVHCELWLTVDSAEVP